MKKFNLELAKQGHPVCTRDGRPVRIICWDRKQKTPTAYRILTLIDVDGDEITASYTNEGRFDIEGETASDLVMVTEKHVGWANVYSNNGYHLGKEILEFEENAIEIGKEFPDYVATVKIEWEEDNYDR